MKRKKRFIYFTSVTIMQVIIVLTASTNAKASDYIAEDIALTPGVDASELNLNWITPEAGTGECAVEIAQASTGFKNSATFYGMAAEADADLDGVLDYYYCAVTVSGLQNQVDYVYHVGDNFGLWSDTYIYSTENRNKYGFVFLSDAQLGSGSAGNFRNPAGNPAKFASDVAQWDNAINVIVENFPETAFIMAAGDNIEYPSRSSNPAYYYPTVEEQWAGYFSPLPLRSIPVAPTTGSHDELGTGTGGSVTSYAFDYHFNLPNEAKIPNEDISLKDYAAGDYYFTYGKALFMVLNLDSKNYTYHGAFMQAAVEANPDAKWRIAMWHYTIYTSAGRGMRPEDLRDQMDDLVDNLDIDLVLMGHDHTFCRSYQMLGEVVQAVETNEKGEVVNPTGTLYISANSASGSKYYSLASDVDSRFWVAAYSQPYAPMFSYIDVDANNLKISTYRADTMEEIDTYTIFKNN